MGGEIVELVSGEVVMVWVVCWEVGVVVSEELV